MYRHYPNLHYLSLSRCTHFTSKGLHSITSGKGCRRLLYLDLSGCTQLTADGFGYIGKGCSILNTLLLDDIPNLEDSMILKLASYCKTLRHISIMGGSKLTDKAFIFLAMENRRLRCIKIESKCSSFKPMLTYEACRGKWQGTGKLLAKASKTRNFQWQRRYSASSQA